jgi:hypothetical protein
MNDFRSPLDSPLRAALVVLTATALFEGACSARKPSVIPTPQPALAPTLTPTASPTGEAATGTPAPDQSAPEASATPAPPAATPAATPPPAPTFAPPPPTPSGTPLVSLTPLPAIISTPCKSGQVKGDKATKNLYPPGFPGYSDRTSNVDCFDSIDAAQSAGYHLPGPPGG